MLREGGIHPHSVAHLRTPGSHSAACTDARVGQGTAPPLPAAQGLTSLRVRSGPAAMPPPHTLRPCRQPDLGAKKKAEEGELLHLLSAPPQGDLLPSAFFTGTPV